jgi:hypothetical protein
MRLSGFSLFGGRSDTRTVGPPLRGSPLLRVRAVTIFTGVSVRDRPARSDVLDEIRAGSGEPTAT